MFGLTPFPEKTNPLHMRVERERMLRNCKILTVSGGCGGSLLLLLLLLPLIYFFTCLASCNFLQIQTELSRMVFLRQTKFVEEKQTLC